MPPTTPLPLQDVGDLFVFSLDGSGAPAALLRKLRLAPGIEVVGLAACPSGCALVVMDLPSRAARVLPWPLTREFLRR